MGHPSLDLDGKVAVVVGATSGIGRVLALGLARAGADVVPTGRRLSHVEEVAGEIEALGRRTARVACDVTSAASLDGARQAVEGALGRIDILVNSAGRTRRTPTLELPESEWSEILETNLTGTLRACRAFAPGMIARGWGRIINIASLASFVGLFEVAAYTASKAGVAGLTRALAVEWGPHGVNVNAIAPGVFRTDFNQALLDGTARGQEFLTRTPLGRFGSIEELQGAAVFLASDAASFVNGEVLAVDGGFLASGVNR
jgi:NAD(P)-dependent dehydrogenase (short-subunit alcohol dehydrogenase family)